VRWHFHGPAQSRTFAIARQIRSTGEFRARPRYHHRRGVRRRGDGAGSGATQSSRWRVARAGLLAENCTHSWSASPRVPTPALPTPRGGCDCAHVRAEMIRDQTTAERKSYATKFPASPPACPRETARVRTAKTYTRSSHHRCGSHRARRNRRGTAKLSSPASSQSWPTAYANFRPSSGPSKPRRPGRGRSRFSASVTLSRGAANACRLR